jgi:hypothetical protein
MLLIANVTVKIIFNPELPAAMLLRALRITETAQPS